jgi:hypothetical protein
MADLKLIAFDPEDLEVIAAHLQDAVLRVEDMAYLKREKRFAIVANRFDWSEASASKRDFTRRRAGLRIERVLSAKVSGLDLSDKQRVLSLLTVTFTPTTEPEGTLTLTFAGGAAIKLEVECVEAALDDLGAAWTTRHKPEHTGD